MVRARDLAAGASFGVHWRVDSDTAVGQTHPEEQFCPGGPLPGLWGAPGDTSPGRVPVWVGLVGGATHGFRKHSIREGGR